MALNWPQCAGRGILDTRSSWRKCRCLPSVRLMCMRCGFVRLCRSEEHTSELQSLTNLVCRLLLEKKNRIEKITHRYTSNHNDIFEHNRHSKATIKHTTEQKQT